MRADRAAPGPLPARLIGLALAGVFLLVALLVAGGQTQEWDRQVSLRLHALAPSWAVAALGGLTILGDRAVLAPLIFVTLLALVLARRYSAALGFALLTAGGGGPSSLVKFIVERARPQLWPDAVRESGYSFPSGHATFIVIVVAALALIVAPPLRDRRARSALGAAAVLLCALVGLSRVVLGVHYASDVLAGFALGAFWVYLFLGPFRASWSPPTAGASPQVLGAAVAFAVFFASRWVNPPGPTALLPASVVTLTGLLLVAWAIWLRASAHWRPASSGLALHAGFREWEPAVLGSFVLGAGFCVMMRDLVLLATFVIFFALWRVVRDECRISAPVAAFPRPQVPLGRLAVSGPGGLPLAFRREADVLCLSLVGIFLIQQREGYGAAYPVSLREGTWYLVSAVLVAALLAIHRRSARSLSVELKRRIS